MRQERKNPSNVEKPKSMPEATPKSTKVAAERAWKTTNLATNLTMDGRSPSDSARWMDELQDPERWDGMS
jgi:hypothetical protein